LLIRSILRLLLVAAPALLVALIVLAVFDVSPLDALLFFAYEALYVLLPGCLVYLAARGASDSPARTLQMDRRAQFVFCASADLWRCGVAVVAA
jgi:hypothetical protein